MLALTRKAGNQVIRKRFVDTADLKAKLYDSLVDELESRGMIQIRPFEDRPCPDATLSDIDDKKVLDFVLSVINRSVGTRTLSPQAPVSYEIPPDVVQEAIVNAIAHRDHTMAGAVQVSVFADRVEVWNAGELLPPLTFESLHKPHSSVFRNPRISEALCSWLTSLKNTALARTTFSATMGSQRAQSAHAPTHRKSVSQGATKGPKGSLGRPEGKCAISPSGSRASRCGGRISVKSGHCRGEP